MPIISSTRARRDELVGFALEVLERDGFASLSIGEIARRAGIKPPSLYKQFSSKSDIEVRLIGLGHEMLARDFERTFEAASDDVDYRQLFTVVVETLRRFAHQYPQLYLLMNSRPFPAAELGREVEVRAGNPFSMLIPDEDLASSFWAWAHGILSLEIVGRLPRLSHPDASWQLLINTVSTRFGSGAELR